MLSVIDGAQVTDNLWGERWAKLCANAMGNPVQAMSGLGSLEVASSEVGRTITIHLAAESARVGLALGYRVRGCARGGLSVRPKGGAGPSRGSISAFPPPQSERRKERIRPQPVPTARWCGRST